MRLFVAVCPPQPVKTHLAETVALLALSMPAAPGQSLRVIPPDRWHITLAFIGDLPDDQVPAAEQAVNDGAAAAVPCVVKVCGGGRFGRGQSTTVWAGIGGDLAGLSAITDAVRTRLRKAHIPFDRKPMRPHLTLARPGDRMPRDLFDQDMRALEGYQGPQWAIGSVYLMSSRLGPRPVHEEIGAWPLPTTR